MQLLTTVEMLNWSLKEVEKLLCQEWVDEVEDALEQQPATRLNLEEWELKQEKELQVELEWAQIMVEHHLKAEFVVELVGLALHQWLVLLHNAWGQQRGENGWVIY